ncbi:MAG: N-6 DNA methylase [Gemmatimonadaceae bacterium]
MRAALMRAGFYKTGTRIRVEEQASSIASVARMLKTASKSGRGGGGSPEFIISNSDNPDFLMVVECKAALSDHASTWVSAMLDGKDFPEDETTYSKRVQRYAVDGALHYANKMVKEFNVVAVAVSGETDETAKVETFLYSKGGSKAKRLQTKAGREISEVLPWDDYIKHATFDPAIQRLRNDELMSFARELHDFMRDHAKLTESEKPLLVSGTLLALRDNGFSAAFDKYEVGDLQDAWLEAIQRELAKANIPQAKKKLMAEPYRGIASHPELGKATKTYPRGPLSELITQLKTKVQPFISIYDDFDVVGQFYGEFLRYTGGDKKALGIVLTPRHVTELFAILANVSKNSTCLDICAGTGGFLISAMVQMLRGVSKVSEIDRVKAHGLIGVEQQPAMYALGASNMILRGDGKANLYQGSCFDPKIVADVKGHKADVGLLNPPFSQKDAVLHELVFVKQMLDCLVKKGTGIAIVPMSCAISPHPMRAAILKEHTLEAVMSMPDELFYPVGTVTCAMIFTAHIPHAVSARKSWFGFWKKDGYIKTKHRGRVDLYDTWSTIRDSWVEMYRNREVHPGVSVTQHVTADDEWCAEAYMETDYSKITQADFERTVRNYAVFRLLDSQNLDLAQPEESVDGASQ